MIFDAYTSYTSEVHECAYKQLVTVKRDIFIKLK